MADDKGIVRAYKHGQSTYQSFIPDRTRPAALKIRTKNSKVRTGCFRCKVRRVKCDETRPSCLRCIKLKVDCDGYPPITKPVDPSRTILPKYSRRPFPFFEQTSIIHIRSGSKCEDDTEGRCFRIYCEKVGSQIAGPFKGTLWDIFIPQMSEEEPFIRHAVIAIGAIGKIMQEQRRTRTVSKIALDYPFAWMHFDQALRGMRSAISNGQLNIRNALIACILVFCFETLAGQPILALKNAESGLMLLYQWMKTNTDQGPTYFFGSPWQHQHIEREIMDGMAGLDMHVMFFLDPRPVAVHKFMIEEASKSVAKMPPTFSTLQMARSFWSLLMRRNYHFIKMSQRLGKVEQCEPWISEKNISSDNLGNLGPSGTIFATFKEPVWQLLPESAHYRNDIERWRRAAAPVLVEVHENGTQEEKVLCTLLQIHQIMNHIMLHGIFFVHESSFDQFLSEFKRMVSLIEYVHPFVATAAPNDLPYQFELGIITPLFFVGLRCRDRAVRDKVIDLISRVHYREGMWDSCITVKFIEYIKELEDSGRDENDFVPEHKRVILTGALIEFDGKGGTLQAMQRTLKGRVYMEKRTPWKFNWNAS